MDPGTEHHGHQLPVAQPQEGQLHPQQQQVIKQSPQAFFNHCLKNLLHDDKIMDTKEVLENKLRFLSCLAELSTYIQWEMILHIKSTMDKALDRGNIDWSRWELIETWLKHAVSNIKKLHGVMAGIPDIYLHANKICIQFNMGWCALSDGHVTRGGKTLLAHICAVCHKLGRSRTARHRALSCLHKHLF
jgi:hypothetical protein